MVRCKRCHRHIGNRTHHRFCNRCWHKIKNKERVNLDRNVGSGSLLPDDFSGVLDRTPFSVMAIIFLSVFGVASLVGNWFENSLISILMIGVAVFLIYKRMKKKR